MTTLSLVTPLGPNFLKDFPFQNTENMDDIDAFAGPCLATNSLHTWIPQLTAITTDPVLGTGGIIRGFYYSIFDQVYAWGEFRFGTTGALAGSGTYSMSLPFSAATIVGASTTIGSAPVLGTGLLWRNASGAARFPVAVHMKTANTVGFSVQMTSGLASREVNSGSPFVWATLDGLTWSARFKKA